MEKLELLYAVVVMWDGVTAMENSMKIPQKIKNRTTIWSSNSPSEYILKRMESRVSKQYLYSYVHCSIIHNSQDVDAT